MQQEGGVEFESFSQSILGVLPGTYAPLLPQIHGQINLLTTKIILIGIGGGARRAEGVEWKAAASAGRFAVEDTRKVEVDLTLILQPEGGVELESNTARLPSPTSGRSLIYHLDAKLYHHQYLHQRATEGDRTLRSRRGLMEIGHSETFSEEVAMTKEFAPLRSQ